MADMKQHMVSCYIELGGDPRNIVVRDATRPVTWTEIPILQALHTPGSVHNIAVTETVERPRTWDEKQRLISIYGQLIVDHVYPGNNPNFEWFMPGVDEDGEDMEPKPAKQRRIPAGVSTE